MYYNNIEDSCWEIKDIIKENFLDENDKEKDTFVLSKEDAHNILKKLREIENEADDLEADIDNKEDDISELEDRISDLEFYDDIPDELAMLLHDRNYDLGTVLELKETITNVLKKRGYNV